MGQCKYSQIYRRVREIENVSLFTSLSTSTIWYSSQRKMYVSPYAPPSCLTLALYFFAPNIPPPVLFATRALSAIRSFAGLEGRRKDGTPFFEATPRGSIGRCTYSLLISCGVGTDWS